MEAQRTFIAQRHPRGDIGAAFFEQAVACGVPQGHAHTLIPVRGSGIDGPNFTGGLARLFIARAVETDEADDLVAVDGDLNLGFAKFDGFAPIGLAFFYRRHALELVIGNQRSEEHTSELQSQSNLVCRLLLEKKKLVVVPLVKFLLMTIQTRQKPTEHVMLILLKVCVINS